LKDLGIDERIIFKWITKKHGGRMWTGFVWLMIRTRGCLLVNSPLGYHTGIEDL
jgi:hypothetical protein